MIVAFTQRWRTRRALYRPAGEVIDVRAYEVAPIDGAGADTIAAAFVERHHYSGSYPAARQRFGLWRRDGELVGVAVFSVPAQPKALDALPCPREEAVELGRLVLLDEVPANGESWFIARAFEQLRRRGFAGVLSFSDPVARSTATGDAVFPGHVGTIYQATNATYTGRATPRTLRVLQDGRVLSARALSKIRGRERGWQYAVDLLVVAGARPPADTTNAGLRRWLSIEVRRCTRALRHGGNHRYLFGLTPACRRRLPASLPYPKFAPIFLRSHG